jgi:hypothetical protein
MAPTAPKMEPQFGHNNPVKVTDAAHPASGKVGIVLTWFWQEAEKAYQYIVRLESGERVTLPQKSLAKNEDAAK